MLMACLQAVGFLVANAKSVGQSTLKPGKSAGNIVIESKRRGGSELLGEDPLHTKCCILTRHLGDST